MAMAKSNGNLFFMKILALVGISSIVYILINIGYSWNFESQLIRTIPSQEIIDNVGQTGKQDARGNVPNFIDEKKFQRPIVSEERYIHDFNYNGTIWPMPQESFSIHFVRYTFKTVLGFGGSKGSKFSKIESKISR